MKPVLDGMLLVEISADIAGAYASMLLAEMGMDCIKVQPPAASPASRQPGFACWDRSKRGVAVDVTSSRGREVVRGLVSRADVLVIDCSPARLRRLGLDYDYLAASNPRLVYCHIPLWGSRGPLAEWLGDEYVVAAYAGIMGLQGGYGQPPVYLMLPLASYGAAMLTAYGAAAALYVREETGRGQKVEVSLLAGAVMQQTANFIRSEAVVPPLLTHSIQQGAAPVYRLYECADGRWLMLCCGNQNFWNKLLIALDRLDLAADPRFEGAPWAVQPVENILALVDIMRQIFIKRPREYWLKLLSEADVPVAPVSTRRQFMEDPQVRHNGMVIEIEDPQFGLTRQIGVPITLTENPGVVKGPAPLPGQHTRQVLEELGYSGAEIAQMAAQGVVACAGEG